jgi:hypothetical protein
MFAIFKEDRVKQPFYRSTRIWSCLETEDESRDVAGKVLRSGSDFTGDPVARISAPAERLSEWRACGVA